jgi:hypothetical protein
MATIFFTETDDHSAILGELEYGLYKGGFIW